MFTVHTLGLAILLVAGILLLSCHLIQRSRGHQKPIKQNAKDYGTFNQSGDDKESNNDSDKLTYYYYALVLIDKIIKNIGRLTSNC